MGNNIQNINRPTGQKGGRMKLLTGNNLIILLMIEYTLVAIAYGFDGNWPKVLYFVGATILSLGVLWMK